VSFALSKVSDLGRFGAFEWFISFLGRNSELLGAFEWFIWLLGGDLELLGGVLGQFWGVWDFWGGLRFLKGQSVLGGTWSVLMNFGGALGVFGVLKGRSISGVLGAFGG